MRVRPVVVIFLGGCVLLLCLIIFVLVGYLFVFHLYLMSKKLSTYDFVKQSQLKRLGAKTATCDQDQEAAARLERKPTRQTLGGSQQGLNRLWESRSSLFQMAAETRSKDSCPKEEGNTPRSSLPGLPPRKPEPSVIRSCSDTGPQVSRDQEQNTSKLTITKIGSNKSLAAGKEETKAASLSPESYTVVQVLGSENSSVELHGLKRVAWSENSNQSSSQIIHMPLEDKQKPQQMSVVQGTTVEESELTLVQKLENSNHSPYCIIHMPLEDTQEPQQMNMAQDGQQQGTTMEERELTLVQKLQNANHSPYCIIHMPLEDKQKPQQMSVVQGTTVEESELTLVQKLRPTEDDQEPSPTN